MPPTPAAAEPTVLRRWSGLAAFYTASFAVLGIYMQFFPVWLHDGRGLTEGDVSLVLSGQTLARTIAGPFWSHRVDVSRRPRAVLRVLSVSSLVAFAAFGLGGNVWTTWSVAFVFGCLYPPMHPIVDALAVGEAQRGGFAFGRVRMVGSLSYLLTILAVGHVLRERLVDVGVVFGLLVATLGATALTSAMLPRGEGGESSSPPLPWWSLLRSRPFVLLLAASALIQGSHALFYNLSTVHWKKHGISEFTSAMLWSEGVLAEIVLFGLAREFLDRFRPTTLMIVGGLGAAVRWLVIGASTDVFVLAAVSWLHALSFALTYLGALRALEKRVPAHQRTTAQGLLGAASSGIGMTIAALAGGFVYERCEGRAFFVMAAFAVLGAGLAAMLRHMANKDQRPLHSSTSAPPA